MTALRHDTHHAARARLRSLRVLRLHLRDALRCAEEMPAGPAHDAQIALVLHQVEIELASLADPAEVAF